ncbi:MAG TPA: hypothetical protein ENI82_00030, partial [Bacteroidetes bacterium]|nr:hypothetical protein [Bacteroidota bacterium]
YSSLTKSTGFGGRFGGGIAYDGSFYASLSTMKYFGGGISQRTGTIGLGGGGFKLHYENDFHVLGLTNKMKISDGGDRWRTAAITASYGDLSVGFTLFTGDPGPSGNRPFRNINGHYTYVAENGSSPDQYRFGAAFIGYKNYRAGWNSEGIRHVIQNRVAHDILTGGSAKWFKRLDPVYPGRFYGGIFNNSKYSLWE